MVSLYESAPGEGNRGPDNFTGNPAEQIQRVTPSSRPVEPSGEGGRGAERVFFDKILGPSSEYGEYI